ncbi:hypothetical protein MASR2M18_21860 [Ignavibacteria bacterium]
MCMTTTATGQYRPVQNDCYNFYREENITGNSYVSRPKIGNGLSDNTPDDYGYTYIACGGNPNGVTAGDS